MNREIIFRGKRTDNNEWVYGNLITSSNGYHFIDTNNELYEDETYMFRDNTDMIRVAVSKVIPETVGQEIGLKDKNGVEIFEGDVVKWDDCSDGRYWRIAVVQLNPDIQFDCSSISRYGEIKNSSQLIFRFGNFIYKDTHNHLYVLGNVHDNLGLIK